MLNQVILVGKVSHCAHLESADFSEKGLLKVLIQSNEENYMYEIDVELPEGIFMHCKNHLHNGITVGIKGRLKNVNSDIKVQAEKITFINEKQ